METPELCQFCDVHPARMTVTRQGPKRKTTHLRLCERCGYVCQVVVQVATLEKAMPGPPCLLCGKLSAVTAEAKSREGQFLGRYRLCESCVPRQDLSQTDILRVATPWTPGIVELPGPALRVFPRPPGPPMPGVN